MNVDFYFRKKIPVAILGATGHVGQKFIQLLEDHPWFEVEALIASEKSAGKSYEEAVDWKLNTPIPKEIAKQRVQTFTTDLSVSLCFSALDSSIAYDLEKKLAEAGFPVVSNSSPHRMEKGVPLVVPEVNPEALKSIKGDGYIVTNPNCVVVGLVMALKPLADQYGLKAVHVSTLQALSGAGFAASKIDIEDNVIPYIGCEEEKVEEEPKKILNLPHLKISAHCNRVGVSDGHLENVSVTLDKPATQAEIIALWNNYRGAPQGLNLPTAPKQPLHYIDEVDAPQPKHHRDLDKSMAVSIGRLRPCANFDWKFSILSHNTVRGAAGCALLNAELLVKEGLLYW